MQQKLKIMLVLLSLFCFKLDAHAEETEEKTVELPGYIGDQLYRNITITNTNAAYPLFLKVDTSITPNRITVTKNGITYTAWTNPNSSCDTRSYTNTYYIPASPFGDGTNAVGTYSLGIYTDCQNAPISGGWTLFYSFKQKKLTAQVSSGSKISTNGSYPCNVYPSFLCSINNSTSTTGYVQNFDINQQINLFAKNTTGEIFYGWTGCDTIDSGTLNCNVTMNTDRTVKANFGPPPKCGPSAKTQQIKPISGLCDVGNATSVIGTGPWTWFCKAGNYTSLKCDAPIEQETLTVNIKGKGTVTPASGTYNYGTQLTLSATPGPGYLFTGWSGACTGKAPCIITMDSSKTINATFSLNIVPIILPLLD